MSYTISYFIFIYKKNPLEKYSIFIQNNETYDLLGTIKNMVIWFKKPQLKLIIDLRIERVRRRRWREHLPRPNNNRWAIQKFDCIVFIDRFFIVFFLYKII